MTTETQIAQTATIYVASPCGCEKCNEAMKARSVVRFPNCRKAVTVQEYAAAAWQDEPHIPTAGVITRVRELHPDTFLVHF